jgi:hypothetical protein
MAVRKVMNKKKVASIISGVSALVLAATCLPALAYGHHGLGGHHHRGADMKFALYAHAAGLTHDQIRSAFQNDTALKTDFQNLRTAKTAMDSCLIAGTCNNNEVATYASAQQALTQEKLTVWQNLFKTAPNKQAAVSLKSQLETLNSQKHQILHQTFSSASNSSANPNSPAAQQ